jgi:hypothetical protein
MKTKRLSSLQGLFAALVVVAFVAACTSVDCPLNNTVYANYQLKGPVTKLNDTLTISTPRQGKRDSVLLNKKYDAENFTLPVSYGHDEDVLFFYTGQHKDTVWMQKTNRPHFESTDCGLNFFHTITGIRYTRHAIDSIVINHKEIDYDASPKHFYIYFKEYRL